MGLSPTEIAESADRLTAVLRGYGSAAVALSGGVDSTLVAAAAYRALGAAAVAVTADSPSVPRADLEIAAESARFIGIRHVILPTDEFNDADYLRNDGARCYFCKSALYAVIARNLSMLGASAICSGANLDDRGDYRPGLTAAAERGIRHPLQEAGFGKAMVRAVAELWQLPNWNRPASPCLSSRLAPGLAVTPERVGRVEAAEVFLKGIGLPECRVRLHEGELARVEVPIEQVGRLATREVRTELTRRFRELGFRFVTLDLEGFRSGNLNELVPLDVRRRFA